MSASFNLQQKMKFKKVFIRAKDEKQKNKKNTLLKNNFPQKKPTK